VEVKVLPQAGEAYVFVQSADRVAKERSMRRRRLRKYLDELERIKNRKRPLKRDALREKLGGARRMAGRDARFVKVVVTLKGKGQKQRAHLDFSLRRDRLRKAWKREGRYLLRTNLAETDGAKIWNFYLQLTEIEEAFKDLKGDLALRPIYHPREHRIDAHILVSFLAYALHATLKARLRLSATGLTPRV
jgi:transposase